MKHRPAPGVAEATSATAPSATTARPSVVRVDPDAFDPAALEPAADALRRGELVAFPTETVYGLGANALDARAVARIFEAKGRPANNPLIVHVAHVDQARALVTAWPDAAERLARAFWPGPLTLVLPRRDDLPAAISAGLGSVGLRIPAHPVARALIERAGVPVAAPSANRYTQVSPTTAAHVVKGLGARVDWIVDGGPTTVGIESTVVSLLDPARPRILRPGMLGPDELARVVAGIDYLGDSSNAADLAATPQLSPGLARKHYAPRARVVLVDNATGDEALTPVLNGEAGPVGWIRLARSGVADGSHQIVLPCDPAGYAERFYGALHALDDAGCSVIAIETPPQTDAWRPIWDRLVRAAS